MVHVMQKSKPNLGYMQAQVNKLEKLLIYASKQQAYVLPHVRRGFDFETRSLDGEADDEHEEQKRRHALTATDIHRIHQAIQASSHEETKSLLFQNLMGSLMVMCLWIINIG